MQNSLKVGLLWTFLAVVLLTLVLVLSITGQQREENNETIQELEQDKNNLKKELKAKKLQEKLVIKPVPKLAPGYSYYPVDKSMVINKIQAIFGTDPRILALVNCESEFSTSVVSPIDKNGYVNVGLFQINMTHGQTIKHWQNIDTNIQKAWELSKGGTNWVPWPSCKYDARLAGFI